MVSVAGFVSYRFFVQKKDPLLEFLTKLVAAEFFVFYLAHRLQIQITNYELTPQFFSVWSWINLILVMILILIFVVSYLTRSAAKVRAQKPIEIFLPLLCAVLPFGVVESASWIHYPFVAHSIFLKDLIRPFYVQTPGHWNVGSIILLLVGNGMTVAALFSLKKSFSILTEVREVVTGGIYKYLRHPMYVGEILATAGLLFLAPSKFNIFVLLSFTVGIIVRAKVEEKKLAAFDGQYQVYQQKVRRWLP